MSRDFQRSPEIGKRGRFRGTEKESGNESRIDGSDSPQEVRKRQFQSPGYFFDVSESDVAFSSLNSPHIRSIESAQVSERLLRHAQPVAQLTNSFSEANANVVHLLLRCIFKPRRLCVHGL